MYDVIVSGAGPAGAIASYCCAKEGLSTLLLERHPLPRTKGCAGGLLQRAIDRLPFELPQVAVEREIFGFVMIVDGERHAFSFEERAGVIVRREIFDQELARRAEKAGATLIEEAPVLRVREGSEIEVTTPRGEFKARAMVIAEGVTSRSARALMGPYPKRDIGLGIALNVETPIKPSDSIEIHLFDTPTKRLTFGPGFPLNGWVFPHRAGANIGLVGKDVDRERMMACLHTIKERLAERCGEVIGEERLLAHPLPIRPRSQLVTRRTIAVGDAAGFANPITGEGMSYAIISGRIAAKVLASELRTESGGRIDMGAYSRACASDIENDLRAAALMSPILHRLVGVVDTGLFFEVFRGDKAMVGCCQRIARGEADWRELLALAITHFPGLFFSSLR